MNITPIYQLSDAQIRELAEQAADHEQGAAANPFPETSHKHAEWARHYYARQRENSIACAV